MTMHFGQALVLLRDGKRVMRSGWNGKNMFLVLIQAVDIRLPYELKELWELPQRPFIMMRDAQCMLVPWLASQTDILAEDWEAA
jgi:hypothetical protein